MAMQPTHVSHNTYNKHVWPHSMVSILGIPIFTHPSHLYLQKPYSRQHQNTFYTHVSYKPQDFIFKSDFKVSLMYSNHTQYLNLVHIHHKLSRRLKVHDQPQDTFNHRIHMSNSCKTIQAYLKHATTDHFHVYILILNQASG